MMGVVLNKLSDRVNHAVEYISLWLFLILTVSCVAQVFFRYVVNQSLSWTEELARHSYIWIVLLGASICVKRGSHAVVEVVVDLLPKKARLIISIFVDILVISGACIMLVQGAKIVPITMAQMSPANEIPMGLIYIAVPISGACVLLHKLADLSARVSKTN